MSVNGEDRTPLTAGVYSSLRRAILLGHYPQGEVLYEQRLAEDLNVSRVPVREVIPLLQRDGLVESTPRRSAVVTTWTPQRVHDLFDARLAVEVDAAGLAARRVRAGIPPVELEEAVKRSQERLGVVDPLDMAESNVAVHIALVAAAGNPILGELINVLSSRMVWLFYLTSGRDLHVQSHEHFAMLDAIRDGNDRLAEAITFAHIDAGRHPCLAALKT